MKLPKRKLTPRKEASQARSKETVETIIRATAHILEKDGFEKASTNKIAEQAGVSIGSLYQYFPTKDAILAFMMEKYMENQLEIIQSKLKDRNSDDLKETIRSIIEAQIESKRKHARFTRIFAQKIFGFNKMDLLKKVDDYTMEIFKDYMTPFGPQLRQENLEMALYIVIQSVKLIPVSILFQDRYKIDDPLLVDELVHLVYQYLRRVETV